MQNTVRSLGQGGRSAELRFIQANLQRSRLATAELHQTSQERGVSVALIQEPYVGGVGVAKQPLGTRVIQCTLGRQKTVKSAIVMYGGWAGGNS